MVYNDYVENAKEKQRIVNRRMNMSKVFTVAIQKEDDWFVAKCLENSVASQGKTMDEASDNLREALTLYYEDEALPILPRTFVTTLEVAI